MSRKMDLQYYDYFFIAVIFLFSFWFQFHAVMNWDLGWHLIGAERMLHGGNYPNAIFDDNLPMVFWFLAPIILLHKITGISLITLTIISIHCVIFICFFLCNTYLKEIYQSSERSEITLIRYAILILLLFFPGWEFGQRDMIVTALSLPYLILASARMETHFQLSYNNAYFQSLLGFLLLLGLAMNPFYGLVWLTVEIQLSIYRKKIVLWRPELLTFVIGYTIYLLLILMIYPNYFTKIIPSFIVFSVPLSSTFYVLLSYYPTLFLIIAIALFFMIPKISQPRWMLTLLLCSILSYAVFIINKKGWPSHIIFFIVFIDLLLFSLFFKTLTSNYIGSFKKITVCLFSLSLLIISTEKVILLDKLNFSLRHNPHSIMNEFIAFFHQKDEQHPHRSVYVFTTQTPYIFPIMNYTRLNYISPGPNCWMIPAIVKENSSINAFGWRKKWVDQYKKIFLDKTTADFITKKPFYVIVDNRSNPAVFPFNYIDYLKKNAAFKISWRHYHLVKEIQHYLIYER